MSELWEIGLSIEAELFYTAFLTILVEVALFYFWGYRERGELLAFAVVNFVSNILFNDALMLADEDNYYLYLVVGEVLVVLFEYLLMLYWTRDDRRALLRTLCATNAFSCFVGLAWAFLLP